MEDVETSLTASDNLPSLFGEWSTEGKRGRLTIKHYFCTILLRRFFLFHEMQFRLVGSHVKLFGLLLGFLQNVDCFGSCLKQFSIHFPVVCHI
ncbi:hypothetical protein DRA42_00285 [Ethanoligenens harbinense]|nr:hypothetical protein CXQ68_00275 [Ethanoligenens harbinense YUAN-3]AYF37511.1 hypothetical protein CXP51_00275 [Ethanoligenens harbinense]AYF40232.1 hypothetical protein CN246_00275 [Ethanoligenens harbinense]QCN91067.1 hypothetical protein DRA42_00285 [Ethanoligenens harbinense]